ncbi:vp80 [Lambdina fiscellaria nucleopolyhedrovirus]|uniref:Vp80 n=1 Tax=Lambdina fiscellaria nucleopolyhedrovirus TaxID=1642929 RepID=A0A0E3URQ5_9ABAC|nr:vp80 [Lambdina fiscellaria nucleopolyhedrovirus]AKC91674.1 vp80 [Lambdina fiscellaria nucleopolyhedrovirus]
MSSEARLTIATPLALTNASAETHTNTADESDETNSDLETDVVEYAPDSLLYNIKNRKDFYKYKTVYLQKNLLHVKVVKIKGDGACIFRAIAYYVFNDENMHMKVRADVVQYIATNWNEFKEQAISYTDSPSGQMYTNVNKYLEDMYKNNTYGTLLEINAAAIIYKRFIVVYQQESVFAVFGEEHLPYVLMLFSGPLDEGHVDALLPVINEKELVLNSFIIQLKYLNYMRNSLVTATLENNEDDIDNYEAQQIKELYKNVLRVCSKKQTTTVYREAIKNLMIDYNKRWCYIGGVLNAIDVYKTNEGDGDGCNAMKNPNLQNVTNVSADQIRRGYVDVDNNSFRGDVVNSNATATMYMLVLPRDNELFVRKIKKIMKNKISDYTFDNLTKLLQKIYLHDENINDDDDDDDNNDDNNTNNDNYNFFEDSAQEAIQKFVFKSYLQVMYEDLVNQADLRFLFKHFGKCESYIAMPQELKNDILTFTIDKNVFNRQPRQAQININHLLYRVNDKLCYYLQLDHRKNGDDNNDNNDIDDDGNDAVDLRIKKILTNYQNYIIAAMLDFKVYVKNIVENEKSRHKTLYDDNYNVDKDNEDKDGSDAGENLSNNADSFINDESEHDKIVLNDVLNNVVNYNINDIIINSNNSASDKIKNLSTTNNKTNRVDNDRDNDDNDVAMIDIPTKITSINASNKRKKLNSKTARKKTTSRRIIYSDTDSTENENSQTNATTLPLPTNGAKPTFSWRQIRTPIRQIRTPMPTPSHAWQSDSNLSDNIHNQNVNGATKYDNDIEMNSIDNSDREFDNFKNDDDDDALNTDHSNDQPFEKVIKNINQKPVRIPAAQRMPPYLVSLVSAMSNKLETSCLTCPTDTMNAVPNFYNYRKCFGTILQLNLSPVTTKIPFARMLEPLAYYGNEPKHEDMCLWFVSKAFRYFEACAKNFDAIRKSLLPNIVNENRVIMFMILYNFLWHYRVFVTVNLANVTLTAFRNRIIVNLVRNYNVNVNLTFSRLQLDVAEERVGETIKPPLKIVKLMSGVTQ